LKARPRLRRVVPLPASPSHRAARPPGRPPAFVRRVASAAPSRSSTSLPCLRSASGRPPSRSTWRRPAETSGTPSSCRAARPRSGPLRRGGPHRRPRCRAVGMGRGGEPRGWGWGVSECSAGGGI